MAHSPQRNFSDKGRKEKRGFSESIVFIEFMHNKITYSF